MTFRISLAQQNIGYLILDSVMRRHITLLSTPATASMRGFIIFLMPSLSAFAQIPHANLSSEDQLIACIHREFMSAAPDTTVREIRNRCLHLQDQKSAVATLNKNASTSPSAADVIKQQAEEASQKSTAHRTPFENRMLSELSVVNESFALLPHRPNYIMPLSYQKRADAASALIPFGTAQKNAETTFQISFKFPVAPPLFNNRAAVFFGYTGRSWWQLYDAAQSRPFRETNHEPELYLAVPVTGNEFLGWRYRLISIGLNHQSNGRSLPYSRSWNRLISEVVLDRNDKTWAKLRLWHRFKEDAKTNTDDNAGDDNPDITRYMGHAELMLGYASGRNNFTLTVRGGTGRQSKGAAQLDWSHPTGFSKSLRWYAQAFDGYGDSLIDYNTRLRRFSMGFMLNDWF